MPTLTRRAQKDLGELPQALRSKAEALIDRLDSEPGVGKKLKGKLKDLRSTRLGRSHRIVYKVDEQGTTILTVRQRKDVYR